MSRFITLLDGQSNPAGLLVEYPFQLVFPQGPKLEFQVESTQGC